VLVPDLAAEPPADAGGTNASSLAPDSP
jgi:hypothetical protein